MEIDAAEMGMGLGIEFLLNLLLSSLCKGTQLDGRSCLPSPWRWVRLYLALAPKKQAKNKVHNLEAYRAICDSWSNTINKPTTNTGRTSWTP